MALYSGLIIVAALLGAAIATRTQERRARLAAGTARRRGAGGARGATVRADGWALDKHLTYGIWFAAIAGGFGCRTAAVRLCGARAGGAAPGSRRPRRLPEWSRRSWRDRRLAARGADVPKLAGREVVRRVDQAARGPRSGLIFASAQKRVAQYYTPRASSVALDGHGPAAQPRRDTAGWLGFLLPGQAARAATMTWSRCSTPGEPPSRCPAAYRRESQVPRSVPSCSGCLA